MKKPSTGIIILNVFICIGIFIPIILVFIFSEIRFVVSNRGINIITESFYEQAGDFTESFIEDVYYDNLGFDEDDMSKKFVKDTEETTREIVNHAIRYAFTGEGEIIDVDYVMEYFEDHAEDIEDITGYEITDDDLDDLRDSLEEELDYMEDEMDDIFEDSETTEIIHAVFSIYNVIIPAVIVLIGLLIMFATFNKRVDKSLKYTGVTFLVSSFAMFAITGFLYLIRVAGSEDSEGVEFLIDLIDAMVKNGLIISGIVLVSSIVLIFVSGSIRKSFQVKYGADFEPGTMPVSNQYFGNPAYNAAPNGQFQGSYGAPNNQFNVYQNPNMGNQNFGMNANPNMNSNPNMNVNPYVNTNMNTSNSVTADENTSATNSSSDSVKSIKDYSDVNSYVDTSVNSYVSTDIPSFDDKNK